MEVKKKRGQALANCFLCDKEQHFYINDKKGLWDCKSCGESGNLYTFLSLLHRESFEATKTTDYERLAKDRSLSIETLKKFNVAKSVLSDDWLVPVYNKDRAIVNLLIYDDGVLKSTSQCSQHLFGVHNMTRENKVLCMEGHWDAMAMDELLTKTRMRDKYDVVAVPGANTFKDEWAEMFAARDAIFIYDNDDAGRNGVKKVVDIFSQDGCHPAVFRTADWRESDENDVRDYLKTDKKPNIILKHIWNRLEEIDLGDQQIVSPLQCDKFEDLVEIYENRLYFTQPMKDTLAVMLAASVSVKMHGEPLWIYVVGPPSSGKSTLAEAMSGSKQFVRALSKLTPHAFVSGWKGEKGSSDASVLPTLRDKTLIVKDFTATLSLPAAVQEELYGILRDAYDNVIRVQYGNKISRDYANIRFSLIACVTDEIRVSNRASLGERFLHIDIIGDETETTKEQMDLAMRCMERQLAGHNMEEDDDSLKRNTLGFMQSLSERVDFKKNPKLDVIYRNKIQALAELISYMRASVKRDHDEVMFPPRRELGIRLCKQFMKLAISLCWVLDKRQVDKAVFRILRKVALDSAAGYRYDIAKRLQGADTISCVRGLEGSIPISYKAINRHLNDMRMLGITDFEDEEEYRLRTGMPTSSKQWFIEDKIDKILEMIDG